MGGWSLHMCKGMKCPCAREVPSSHILHWMMAQACLLRHSSAVYDYTKSPVPCFALSWVTGAFRPVKISLWLEAA